MFKQLLKKQRIINRLKDQGIKFQEEYEKIIRKESSLSVFERQLIMDMFESTLSVDEMEAFTQRNLK